jgi:hypothetical protein
MEWKEIHLLLPKSVEVLDRHRELKKRIADAVCGLLGARIVSERDISIKGRVAHIKAHPTLKNELLVRKREIFNLLRAGGGTGGRPTDIQ